MDGHLQMNTLEIRPRAAKYTALTVHVRAFKYV